MPVILLNIFTAFQPFSRLQTTRMSSGANLDKNFVAMSMRSLVVFMLRTDKPSGRILYTNCSMYFVLDFVPIWRPDFKYVSNGTIKSCSVAIIHLVRKLLIKLTINGYLRRLERF